MLDYAHGGTAKVKVEYVGRAPLDGHDDQYLMASYRPGNRAPDPSDGLPTGVMIAMNGSTPSDAAAPAAAAFPGTLVDAPAAPQAAIVAVAAAAPVETPEAVAVPFATAQASGFAGVVLPDFGPIVPERPDDLMPPTQLALATMSYADDRVDGATGAFAMLEGGRIMSPSDVVQSWKRLNPDVEAPKVDVCYVAAGSFEAESEARTIADHLARFGKAVLDKSEHDGEIWYSVNLYADGRYSLDAMLEAAWSNGAPDAMTIRD
jgi:rare lipoprotein A